MAKARFKLSELKKMGFMEDNGTFVRKSVTKVSKSDKKVSGTVNKNAKSDLFILTVSQSMSIDIVPEYRFDLERRWRFDYAIPSHKIAIEVEGGVWTNGRHTKGKGYIRDMEKYNRANALGWRLIRVVPDELVTGSTLDKIKDYLEK
ncbi:MAG: hypothetical protein QHC79_09370 [Pseudosphingobacterium sp.]|nr:hypothetical protein [Pseudosphingobacterium sp.]